MTEKQNSTLHKRVVSLIRNYPPPKEIYQLITQKENEYIPQNQTALARRDRALLAMHYTDAGRGAEITGGNRYRWDGTYGEIIGKKIDRKTKQVIDKYQGKSFSTGQKHQGLLMDNIKVTGNFIEVKNAPVVKRTQKMIQKSQAVTRRNNFMIPLKTGVFDKWLDQLIPFGWLILEYIKAENLEDKPKETKLFQIENRRAYQICRAITGNYLNWFRAMGEQFWGLVLHDSEKLAQFVNIQDSKHVKHYTRFDMTSLFLDKTMAMDFDWIEPTVEVIKSRIGK